MKKYLSLTFRPKLGSYITSNEIFTQFCYDLFCIGYIYIKVVCKLMWTIYPCFDCEFTGSGGWLWMTHFQQNDPKDKL